MHGKKFLKASLVGLLLLTTCSNDNGPSQAVYEKQNTGKEAEENEKPVASDEDINNLKKKFKGMENDDFIESIEPLNDDYSEIVIHIDENAANLDEETMTSKIRGIGESVRGSTAGILHDGADDKLPVVEFRNSNGDIVGKYESRSREAEIKFNW